MVISEEPFWENFAILLLSTNQNRSFLSDLVNPRFDNWGAVETIPENPPVVPVRE